MLIFTCGLTFCLLQSPVRYQGEKEGKDYEKNPKRQHHVSDEDLLVLLEKRVYLLN